MNSPIPLLIPAVFAALASFMTLKILRYEGADACRYHVCRTEEGDVINIDLMVDGSISITETAQATNESFDAFCESLVGRDVECETLHPFLLLAQKVKLL